MIQTRLSTIPTLIKIPVDLIQLLLSNYSFNYWNDFDLFKSPNESFNCKIINVRGKIFQLH